MQTTEFIYHEGKFIPWHEAKVHVLSHTFHYGGGVFEGIRAYPTDKGAAIFRLKEHVERLIYSGSVLQMDLGMSVAQISDIIVELVRKNKLPGGYIRPLVYWGYGVMGINPRDSKAELMVACWPWGKYLSTDAADIKVSKYIRIHPRSTVADAKIVGHYVNSILAVQELKGTKYHEALFLDSDGNIAEGPGENIFFIFGKEIVTPPLGTILAGITRATAIELATELGYKVVERTITLDEALKADEAFFTGTAAEITPIGTINDIKLKSNGAGPVSTKIKATYLDLVQGKSAKHSEYLTYVK